MTDPDRAPGERRPNPALWVALGLMVLIVAGGLAYSLSFPSYYASNPPQTTGPQTTGSSTQHPRPDRPL
jgi:hypothetical protein